MFVDCNKPNDHFNPILGASDVYVGWGGGGKIFNRPIQINMTFNSLPNPREPTYNAIMILIPIQRHICNKMSKNDKNCYFGGYQRIGKNLSSDEFTRKLVTG